MILSSSSSSLSAARFNLSPLFPPHKPSPLRRRRAVVAPRSQLSSSSSDSLFRDLLFNFPSPDFLNFFVPALGVASGVSLYLSNRPASGGTQNRPLVSDIGEWVLFSSPSPFNRFVLLRCPSLSLQGSELLKDVNGRMRLSGLDGRRRARLEEKLKYQRVCVAAEDGGVVSLDWPENLDLREERGLDTTLLLVPGTVEGSLDSNVKSFVCEALRFGFFPIVMNPRGCAGSPLTTARLFTAADSDDICTAIQFIKESRPWTVLVGVGWGYGANMLTKYLAEVGDKTPLTAATCIDCPFDLEEASRASRRRISVDQKLTSGLKDILQSNKELFQGKPKGFDVEKALSAKSIRDFEKAISMVSYGFEAIEDFYSESSTRDVVGNVKIPVLFLQSDDGTVPKFSVPRSLIAENPFTSLLSCSCSSPIGTASSQSATTWCQDLTIEWLAAVELGLLKGRHPLLKDVDVTIKPSKGLPLVDVIRSEQSSWRNSELKDLGIGEVDSGDILQQTGAVDPGLVEEEENSPLDSETAEVVMNMLDATMSDTLTEEKKQKILDAMGQGETLVKALQDAVPEDVREKLRAFVSSGVLTQGTNLKVAGQFPMDSDLSSGMISRIQENGSTQSSPEGSQDHNSSNQMKVNDNVDDAPDNSLLVEEKPAASFRKDADVLENDQSSKEKDDGLSSEEGSETGEKPNFPDRAEEVGVTEEAIFEEHRDQDHAIGDVDAQENSKIQKSEEKPLDGSKSKSDSNAPNFSVTEAWGALTGMEDSTQVAVNSVYGVIEDMITQLDDSDDENKVSGNDGKDKKIDSVNAKHGDISAHSLEKEENDNNLCAQSDTLDEASAYNTRDVSMDSQYDSKTGCIEKQEMQNPISQDMDVTEGYEDSSLVNHLGQENTEENGKLVGSEFQEENSAKLRYGPNVPLYITRHLYGGSLHNEYFHKYLLSKMPTESLDIDATALLLDYFAEKDQWKRLEQPENGGSSIGDDLSSMGNNKKIQTHLPAKASYIEPSYVVYDTEQQHEAVSEYELEGNVNKAIDIDEGRSDKISLFLKSIILDSLKVEVDRKLSTTEIKDMELYLAKDLEHVAHAVSLAVGDGKEHSWCLKGEDNAIDCSSEKVGTLCEEHIVTAISSAFRETYYLKTVLPVGVIVGSSLAALSKFFDVAPVLIDAERQVPTIDQTVKSRVNKVSVTETDRLLPDKSDKSNSSNSSKCREEERVEVQNQNKDSAMAGEVTAVVGASSLLVRQQEVHKSNGTADSSSNSLKDKNNNGKVADKLEEAMSEESETNIVTSLAEKAMAVAGPVVPTKKDGEVDQERIVALLTNLGQKGGMLRVVGKFALLWGGIRGAMSLTDRLISFLRIAERPLFQRILGFIGMVLVLWSPVAVPLLPTLTNGWMTHTPSRIVEFACVSGLYAAVFMLVVLWGNRIRGFENPLEQYGLDVTSWPKVHDLLKGTIGGVLLVLSIHLVNSLLGYISFARPPSLPSSSVDVVTLVKVYRDLFLVVTQGIGMAVSIALVEELIFRSWLPEEIAADLGYHRGIIISGLAFAIFQRSPWSIPGLWLLSLGLAGSRQRSEGSLSIPIGLHAGIIASSFILQNGGFLSYKSNFHHWLIGSHPSQPFSGVVGFAFSLLFAVTLYPRQHTPKTTEE